MLAVFIQKVFEYLECRISGDVCKWLNLDVVSETTYPVNA